MKKNLFKFLLLIVGLIFTVGCEMTLSFNDYNEAVKTRDSLKTTTANNNGTNGGNSTNGNNNTNSSTTTTFDNLYTRPTTTTIPITKNQFDVVLITPFGQTHTITVTRWTNVTIPDEFKEGFIIEEAGVQYQVVGYYTDPNYQNRFNLETEKVEKDMEIYVKFEKIEPLPDKVTITYVSNGGVETQSLVVDRGTKISYSQLPTITKLATDDKRFIFGGWYYDVDYVLKVNYNDVIEKDTKIYAKWREVINSGLYEYTESEDLTSYNITAYLGKADNSPEILTVPSEFNGKPVLGFNCTVRRIPSIKKIILSEGIKECRGSFYFLPNLTSITFPSTLELVKTEYSITQCYKLVEVYNPSNVDLYASLESGPLNVSSYYDVPVIHTSLNEPSVIHNNSDYEYAILPDNNSNKYVLLNYKKTIPSNGLLYLDTLQLSDDPSFSGYDWSIGGFCFYNNQSIKKVIITKAVKEVLKGAFYDCKEMETLEIHGAWNIGDYAFYGLSKLDTVFLTETTREYGTYVFGSSYAKKVFYTGLDANDWINQHFSGDSSTPMNSSGSLFYVMDSTNGDVQYQIKNNESTLNFKQLTEIVLNEGIKEIYPCQFSGFKDITKLRVPNSLEVLGNQAFGLNGLEYYNNSTKLYTKIGNAYYYGNETNPCVILLRYEFINNHAPNDTTPDSYTVTIDSRTKFIYHNGINVYGRWDPSSDNLNPRFLDDVTVILPDSVIGLLENSISANNCYANIRFGRGISYIQRSTINSDAFMNAFIYNTEIVFEDYAIQAMNNPNAFVVYFMGTKEQWNAIIENTYDNMLMYRSHAFYYSSTMPTDDYIYDYFYWKDENTLRVGYWGHD